LCARSGGPPVHVSRELFDILSRAQDVSRRSNGAFDVTIGPLVQLWRESRKSLALPTHDAIAAAKARVGWRNMRLERKRRTVKLLVPGMRLDLGGIGKGYAADAA